MNKLIIVGNVGQDAEIRQVSGSQTKSISFSVAVNRSFVNNDGEKQTITTWFNCTKWVQNNGSTEISKWLKSGTQVLVVGEITAHPFKSTKTNEWVASLDLNVREIELLGSKKEEAKKDEDPMKPNQNFSDENYPG